jgi:hypothetical protein
MTYTAPERSTERAKAVRVRAAIYRAGGCTYCLHRLTNWGGCEQGRTFPLCLKTPGTEFELDQKRLKGASNGL